MMVDKNSDTLQAAEAIDNGTGNGKETIKILKSINDNLQKGRNGKPSKHFYISIVSLAVVLISAFAGGLWQVSRWVANAEISDIALSKSFTGYVAEQKEKIDDICSKTNARFSRLEIGGSIKADNNASQIALMAQNVESIETDIDEINTSIKEQQSDIRQILIKIKD